MIDWTLIDELFDEAEQFKYNDILEDIGKRRKYDGKKRASPSRDLVALRQKLRKMIDDSAK